MSVRNVMQLAGRKCLKVLRCLRHLRRPRRVHNSPKFDKIQPEENMRTQYEENICLNTYPRNTPPFPTVEHRTTSQRTPSVYENINCSYDSAYDSEGIDYIDASLSSVEENEANHSSARRGVGGPWVERHRGEKETFENIWNETIESLVTLS